MDQHVTLLERDVGTSSKGTGLAVETFTPRAGFVWAMVTPLRGGESFQGAQRQSESTHRFRIRFRADIDETWRLRWRGNDYDIVEILPAGYRLKEWLDILATSSPAENRA